MRGAYFADGESISKIFLSQSLSCHQPHRRYIRGRKTSSLRPVFLAIKTLKVRKVAGCDESCLEMFKVLHSGVLYLTRVRQALFWVSNCLVFWRVTWHRKIVKLVWSSPYTRRGTGSNTPTTQAFLSLAFLEKYMPRVLKKCRKIIEPELEDTQCGFRPSHSFAYQIFTLQQIFEKSWEYAKSKDVYACFVDIKKHCDRVLHEKLRNVLREYDVDGRLWLAVSHCIPAQKFVSVSAALNHKRSICVLDFDRVCYPHSFSQLNRIDTHRRVD